MSSSIFLSASVPSRAPFTDNLNLISIREAILGLIVVAGRDNKVVFGGHPAISPLIEHASRSLGCIGNIHIYQSLCFEDKIPPVAKKFPNLHWTKAIDGPTPSSSLAQSLSHMREAMISSATFSAAVVVAGMEGIYEEVELFKRYHPEAPIYYIGSTGGAAKLILTQLPESDLKLRLQTDFHYRQLFSDILTKKS